MSSLRGGRGARPRTLGAGLVPVFVGTAAAGHVIGWRFGAALLVAAGLQIGVNYANDYFDGVRGVDTHERIGPAAAHPVGRGQPRAVLTAALFCLGVAAVRRARAGARHLAGADPGRGRARPRGGAALLGRTASLRGPRARRADGVRLLRTAGDVRHRLRAGGDRALRRVVVRGRDGVARRRDPGGQQPARHPHRCGRGQAHARGAARRRAHPHRSTARASSRRFVTIVAGRRDVHRGRALRHHAVGAASACSPGCPAIKPDGAGGHGERARPDPRADRHGAHARGVRAVDERSASCCGTPSR